MPPITSGGWIGGARYRVVGGLIVLVRGDGGCWVGAADGVVTACSWVTADSRVGAADGVVTAADGNFGAVPDGAGPDCAPDCVPDSAPPAAARSPDRVAASEDTVV